MDWYEKNIELEVRPIVKLLRDNGINTECSCGHEMYIQCSYNHDGSLKELDSILFCAGYQDYEIITHIIREKGFLRKFLNIEFH